MSRAWVVVALVLFVGPRLSAHPVATTTVSISVDGARHCVATITAEADPLISKLEALSFDPLPADSAVSFDQRAARLRALSHVLVGLVDLRFDEGALENTAVTVDVSDTGQASVRLAGDVPTNARTMTWASSLVYGAYPVAFHSADRRDSVMWVQGTDRTAAIPLEGVRQGRAIARAIWLGFTHILPNGIDHILFVVGLFLLSTRAQQLLAQVTAFTVAHSITLGLSLYGVVSLPAHIVEPLIALSVAYVGIENLITARLHPWRIVIVFGFGLLHGLGFAEALASLHLSRPEMLSTLLSFNVGVEAGQLSVIGMAAVIVGAATLLRRDSRRPIAAVASGAIGLTGLCWTIQRVF